MGIRLADTPPELLIFDVDGTLNGIELWWPDLLRKGLRRFAEAMGLVLAEPIDGVEREQQILRVCLHELVLEEVDVAHDDDTSLRC